MLIGSFDFHRAAHAGAAIRSVRAVAVVRGRAADKAGEDAVDDGLGIEIGARLEACVSDVRLAFEGELLGVVVS